MGRRLMTIGPAILWQARATPSAQIDAESDDPIEQALI
jgi:hypothetical protein